MFAAGKLGPGGWPSQIPSYGSLGALYQRMEAALYSLPGQPSRYTAEAFTVNNGRQVWEEHADEALRAWVGSTYSIPLELKPAGVAETDKAFVNINQYHFGPLYFYTKSLVTRTLDHYEYEGDAAYKFKILAECTDDGKPFGTDADSCEKYRDVMSNALNIFE